MQDKQLYAQILGIQSPWRVERVELTLDQGSIHVYLEHEPQEQWQCSECAAAGPLYDHQDGRQWRHLDTCQYQTILHAKPPRLRCPEHGVRVARLPSRTLHGFVRTPSYPVSIGGQPVSHGFLLHQDTPQLLSIQIPVRNKSVFVSAHGNVSIE